MNNGDYAEILLTSDDPTIYPKLNSFKIAAALDSMTSSDFSDASLNSVVLKLYQGNALVHDQDLGISTTSDFASPQTINITHSSSFNKARLYFDISGTSSNL